MKKSILIILVLASTRLFAQDSTKVLNLSLKVSIIEYLAPSMITPTNDERVAIFLKWRTAYRAVKTPVNIVTDTISTTLLALLYNQTLSSAEGIGVSALMKAGIATARSANKYLNRLCTEYELQWVAIFNDQRNTGKKLLSVK